MDFKYKGKTYQINRYPKSSNKSLRPWSASDELALKHIELNNIVSSKTNIYNDRFGFFRTILNESNPNVVVDYKSQEKAIIQNLNANNIPFNFDEFYTPSSEPKNVETAIIKIPKSLDLFEFHLQNIAKSLTKNGLAICHFMTRNFSKQMVGIAGKYFESVEQTKAEKKARLMILKTPKNVDYVELTNDIKFKNKSFKQYFGVFSSKNIDFATQFLLENLTIPEQSEVALDLASGNGVVADFIRQKNISTEIHLVDDMKLAIDSSKVNLTDENTYFHWNNSLEEFESGFFDFIVTNPPFHFEYETNIEVSLELFKQAKRCLKKSGQFWVVANKHLNYKSHLDKIFNTEIVNQNDKFVVYKCKKV